MEKFQRETIDKAKKEIFDELSIKVNNEASPALKDLKKQIDSMFK